MDGQERVSCWCEAAEQWLVEEELIRTVDLPLNLDQNRHHAFHAELSRLQAEQKAKARELPTLPRQAPIGARRRSPLEAAPVDELG